MHVGGMAIDFTILSGNLPMKRNPFVMFLLVLLFTSCTNHSPGRFDFDGPYPLIRYDDGTDYELPSGNGHH
ncbi:MAG: hypothetical protein QNJ04_04395 [Desulfobacterales bacterium]|nr:hypothetical protein [Desulfobacterales bacterium]